MRKIRCQDGTSVGGYPVAGKIAHSSVPRNKIGRPLRTNCVPRISSFLMPKVTVCPAGGDVPSCLSPSDAWSS